MEIKTQIFRTYAKVFVLDNDGYVKINVELFKNTFSGDKKLLMNEWGINWGGHGTVSINYTNDFSKVLQVAIKTCMMLNNTDRRIDEIIKQFEDESLSGEVEEMDENLMDELDELLKIKNLNWRWAEKPHKIELYEI